MAHHYADALLSCSFFLFSHFSISVPGPVLSDTSIAFYLSKTYYSQRFHLSDIRILIRTDYSHLSSRIMIRNCICCIVPCFNLYCICIISTCDALRLDELQFMCCLHH